MEGNTNGLKKGDTVRINDPSSLLDGAVVTFIRQSRMTSVCVVQLREARGAYAEGDHIMVKPWELK